MRRALTLAMLFVAIVVAGCATATRGTTEQVMFLSDPSGAEMTTTNGLKCVTPCTLEVERSETFTATFSLADQKKTVFVDTEVPDEVAATTVANVLATPIILIPVAIAVDAASGANLNHTPNPVKVSFPDVTPAQVTEATVQVPKMQSDQSAVEADTDTKVETKPPTQTAAAEVKVSSGEAEKPKWEPHIGGY